VRAHEAAESRGISVVGLDCGGRNTNERVLASEQGTSPGVDSATRDSEVPRYAVQPAPKATTSLELIDPLVHANQHELRDVLGLVGIVDDTLGPPSDTIAYTARELVERRRVAAPYALDERRELVFVARTCDRDLHRMHDHEMA
jgi:hypothetical protein